MKNKNLKINFLIIIILLSYPNKAYSLTKSDGQQAILNTAKAFQNKGYYLQYDDGSMTYSKDGRTDKKSPRSECGFSPEEISYQNMRYSSCSPFLLNIYYDTFQKNGTNYRIRYGTSNKVYTTNSNHFTYIANPYKTDFYNSSLAIYNVAVKSSCSQSTTNFSPFSASVCIVENKSTNGAWGEQEITYTDKTTFINNRLSTMKSRLEPGDIIGYIYDSGNNSHVIMYIGKNSDNKMQFIHSFNGSTYNYTKKHDITTEKGTVLIWTEDDLLDPNKSYSFMRDDLTQISIIRPLNEIIADNYSLTTNAQARTNYPELVSTKTSSTNSHGSVNIGGTIEYTIELINKSTTDNYENISITDVIPTNTEFISCNGNFNCSKNSNNLTWNVNIPADSTKKVTYKVKVNRNNSLIGTRIVNDKTKVNNITLNKIETMVNGTFMESGQTNITNKANTLLTKTTKYSITEVLNNLYSDYNITFDSSVNLFNKFFTSSTSNGKTFYNFEDITTTSDNIKKMYVKELFGGYYVDVTGYTFDATKACQNNDGRNKTYRDTTFTVGDILIVRDSNYATEMSDSSYLLNGVVFRETNIYVYIGNGEFITIDNSGSNNTGKVVKIDSKMFRTSGNNIYKYTQNGTITYNNTNYTMTSLYNYSNRKWVKLQKTDNSTVSYLYFYRLIESLLGQDAFIVLRPSFSSNYLEFDSSLNIKNNTITKINNKTTVDNMLDKINSGTGDIKVYKNTTQISNTSNIGTGYKIKITLPNETREYTTSVKGDTTGDGNVNVNDIVDVANTIVGKKSLSGVYYTAGNCKEDNSINVSDIVEIAKLIVN